MQIEMKKRESIYKGEDIWQLIPQRPPIVMVDSFEGIEGDTSYSGLTVADNNLFCQGGVLQEAGLIEHIAQSAAARIGYLYLQQHQPVPLGFIGSVEKMSIYDLPQIGAELQTQITVIQEVFDITLITAQVTCNEELLAECRMKIYLKKE